MEKDINRRLIIHPEADKSELLDNVRAAKSILRYFPTTTIKIREHVFIHKVKNPEYLIGGHIADRKGIRGEKGIKNAFLSAIPQGCEAIVIDLDMNIRTLNIKRLTSHLYWRNSDFASNIINRCYVIYRNQAIVITKDDMDKNKITEKLEKLQPYVILWLYKTVQLEVIALSKHSHPIAKLINFHSIILCQPQITTRSTKKLQELLRLTNRVLPVNVGRAVRDSVRENFRKEGFYGTP